MAFLIVRPLHIILRPIQNDTYQLTANANLKQNHTLLQVLVWITLYRFLQVGSTDIFKFIHSEFKTVPGVTFSDLEYLTFKALCIEGVQEIIQANYQVKFTDNRGGYYRKQLNFYHLLVYLFNGYYTHDVLNVA